MTTETSGEGDCPPAIYAETFKLFSKFGDTKSDGKHITLSQSDKWMKQAKVIDGKTITSTDTGIYFKKLKQHKVTFADYNKFLEDLAKAKKVDVEEIKRKLSNCGPPGLSSNVVLKKPKHKVEPSTIEILVPWSYYSHGNVTPQYMENSTSVEDISNLTYRDVEDEESPRPTLSEACMQFPETRPTIDNEEVLPQELLRMLHQQTEDEQIFGDYVASEMRQLKAPANKRKLKRLINQAIIQMSDLDASEYESYSYADSSNSASTSSGFGARDINIIKHLYESDPVY
ncbi:uncharacterized protein LOC106666013 isoform X2 [Cimex lectularius]|uniref:Tubulin polymerization-promoting protein homolog n=1 Tax=Cimex lectularius TaxID=79782 RepID=A0A8I6RNU4_CIMLE|nr:uncharacterized protein LOC106666013 isoform X2 [Cimex lectularius]